MFDIVSFANGIFKSLSEPKTITVSSHSKEKEWGLPLVRIGQGSGERDIYDMSQTQHQDNNQELKNA